MKLYSTEHFLVGDKSAGHAVYRGRRGWTASVWQRGRRVRTDIWSSKRIAVCYALMRAEMYGSATKREVRAAAKQAGVYCERGPTGPTGRSAR